MRSLLATLAALSLSASALASDTPHSPRIPGWKAGDAITVTKSEVLPHAVGTLEMIRLQDDDQSLEIVAVGAYSQQTNASGRHTYTVTSVGEAFGPGDFLKFYPNDGLSPSFMIWLDPAGLIEIADTLIKAER